MVVWLPNMLMVWTMSPSQVMEMVILTVETWKALSKHLQPFRVRCDHALGGRSANVQR